MTNYNNWEHLSTGNFLNLLGPCRPALLWTPIGLTLTALHWSALWAVTQQLSELLLLSLSCNLDCCLAELLLLVSLADLFFRLLPLWSNRLTLEACFSLTQEEAHVTTDTIVDFASLETSCLVTTKHVTILFLKLHWLFCLVSKVLSDSTLMSWSVTVWGWFSFKSRVYEVLQLKNVP
jgi:hypothetical protein